jgi:hypothetical protein
MVGISVAKYPAMPSGTVANTQPVSSRLMRAIHGAPAAMAKVTITVVNMTDCS